MLRLYINVGECRTVFERAIECVSEVNQLSYCRWDLAKKRNPEIREFMASAKKEKKFYFPMKGLKSKDLKNIKRLLIH